MSKLSHIPCTDKFMNKGDFACEACILAKVHRVPFILSTSMAFTAFKLIHMDLWGPYRVSSMTRATNFLTIVYDYTRCTWVYLMQNKMQTATYVQNFIAYVQNHF